MEEQLGPGEETWLIPTGVFCLFPPHALRDFWANADTVLGRISRIFFLGFNLISACFDLVKQNVSSRVNFSLLKNMARHSSCKSESNNPGRLCLEHDLCLEFFMALRTSIGFTNIESSLRSVCSLGVSEEMEGRISRKEFSKSSPLHLWGSCNLNSLCEP